jgi:cell wall-associated NlpC family hydrolase
MKRLIPLFAAVLALALAGTAAADTFRVATPHAGNAANSGRVAPSGGDVQFTQGQNGPMSFAALRGIWQAAGNAYGIPWEVLAAINKVETNFGRNLGPSSAGAVGWMQFMPSTWARWGVDANGDGVADPNNPTDAIFSAARYLAGCGGQFDIARAVYCYNHANWYVSEVLGLAALYSRGGGAEMLGGNAFLSNGQLQARMKSARTTVAASKSQIAAARAEAKKLAGAESRFLRVAATAHLLSGQLEANKRAVLLGVRERAADAQVNRLQKRLDFATEQLGKMQDEASGAVFTNPGYSFPVGGGFVPVGQDNGVVSIALQYLGIPYTWAGASPMTGFDCSGLVQYVYAQLGVSLPHNTVAQWNSPNVVSVPRNALRPGDLVFFNGLDHVGIYIGYGDIIDAPHTGTDVRIDSLSEPWFAANYDGAKRVVSASLGGASQSSGTSAFTTTALTAASGSGFSSNVVYFTR